MAIGKLGSRVLMFIKTIFFVVPALRTLYGLVGCGTMQYGAVRCSTVVQCEVPYGVVRSSTSFCCAL